MAQITEDYVSFETAKLLKEKGFRYDTSHYYYDKDGDLLFSAWSIGACKNEFVAPTIQMAMKWLREVHNIFINIMPRFSMNADKDVCFSYSCKKLIDIYKIYYEISDGEWLNYEEACESAIKYCLENLV